jgi:serine/threonine protein kinase/tetratricopeptide (TPR) repeat protein
MTPSDADLHDLPTVTAPLPASASDLDDPRVLRAVEEYAELLRGGERPDRAAFVARYPDIADALARCLDGLEFVHAAGNELSRPGTGPADGADLLLSGVPLGDFRLIREIGRGGMGIVYEAEQLSLGRRVALKVLPYAATMDARHLQRFKNEARAAASLHHEHIVPVYGVGCERGVHYYAMQLIDGASLAQMMPSLHAPAGPAAGDETGPYPPAGAPTHPVAALSTDLGLPKERESYRAVARLIADAADALEYAHGMGLVHRDVKPGNLIVDTTGKLWVADFGLARFGPDAGLTMSGDILGTLRYMAPEQALAKHGLVDHRADVYGLGATLYELLTGRPAVAGEGREEVLRKIAFEEPAPPRALDRAIPAELETVALKCLAKDPAERYATAGELAEDLRRFLRDEPIRARPPTLRQRAGKWARRHHGVVATAGVSAALVLLLAIAGLAVSNRLIRLEQDKTQEERDAAVKEKQRADEEAAVAEAVTEFLREDILFQSTAFQAPIGDKPPPEVTLKEAVERAAAKVGERFKGKPYVEARVRATIGNVLLQYRDLEPAARQTQAAVDLFREVLGEADDRHSVRALNLLAWIKLRQGRYTESEKLHVDALDRSRRALGEDHALTWQARGFYGHCLTQVGKYPESESVLLRCLERDVRDGETPDAQMVRNNLGILYRRQGRLADAEAVYRKALAENRRLQGDAAPNTLILLGNLTVLYLQLGRVTEAERILQERLAGERKAFGSSRPRELAGIQTTLGKLYIDQARYADAVRLLEPFRDDVQKTLGPDHTGTLATLDSLAEAYLGLRKLAEAIRLFEQLRDVRVKKFGPDHPNTLATLNNLGTAYLYAGKRSEAIALFEQVRDANEAKYGSDHPRTLTALQNLGAAHVEAGKLPEAIRLLEHVGAAQERTLGTDHRQTLDTLDGLAVAYGKAKQLDKSIALGEDVLRRSEATLGRDHPDTLRKLANLGGYYSDADRPDDAIPLLEEAYRKGRPHPELAWVGNRLGTAYVKAGKVPEAARLVEEQLDTVRQQVQPDSPQLAVALARSGRQLLDLGQFTTAEPLLRECLALREKLAERKQVAPWEVANAKALLGGALLGAKEYARAEPLLMSGYEGLKQNEKAIPAVGKSNIPAALGRLVELFEATGKTQDAAKWRKELEALRAAQNKPEP